MIAELHPGQTFAGYRIEAVAGRGGMGVVYRATDVKRGRTVALKLIATAHASESGFRERLLRESRVLASIDHPNVIAFYEAGEADGQLFISMRFVDGVDLRFLIAEEGRLPPEQAARIVGQVAAGLDAAHANGLVHRDVTPANVLIEWRNATQRAYLSDFGLTKEVSPGTQITRSGDWVGTLDYVAPEQIEGRRVDARTDVYSLGCVLFEALTGRIPFVRDSDSAKLWAHVHAAPPSARELRPELPAQTDEVLARAMAKDPAERYPSAGDFGRAAVAAAGGERLTAPGHSVATGAAAPAPADDETRPVPATASASPARPRLRRPAMAAVLGALLLGAAAAAVALTDDQRGFEPGQPRVDHISLGGLAIPSDIVADRSAAYVLDGFAGTVFKLDRGSGQIERRVRVGGSPTGVALDTDDDRVWVLNGRDETVSEIDSRRGKRVGRPFRSVPNPSSLVALDDALVLLSRSVGGDATLMRVDKQSRRRIGRVVDAPEGITDDIAPAGSGVAVTTSAPAALTTYSARLERVGSLPLTASYRNGAPVEAAIDPESKVAWVVFSVAPAAGNGDNASARAVVLRLDTATGDQIGGPIDVGRGATELAIDKGVVWIASIQDRSVTRIDARSGRLIGKPIDVGPNTGDVAASGGVAWIAGEQDVIRIVAR